MNVEIVRNFSRCAAHYDKYSKVQQQVASQLVKYLNGMQFDRILDVGCGTGIFTRRLCEQYPNASIQAIDICKTMIEAARTKLRNDNTEFIRTDAEEFAPDADFDLIASNACFQWFQDLPKTLQRYNHLLTNDGVILFSMFGPNTFCELRESLRKAIGNDYHISAESFVDARTISSLLNDHFEDATCNTHTLSETYESLLELLQTIKYSGTSGYGLNGKTLSRSDIERIENYYRREFGEISVTYEVFYCSGRRQKK